MRQKNYRTSLRKNKLRLLSIIDIDLDLGLHINAD